MHEYYAENKEMFQKEMKAYLQYIAPELEKELKRPYEKIFQETWEYYESEMLENFPYIGGEHSSGTRNLTGAFDYVALGVICTRHGMSLDRWGRLMTLSYQRYFAQMPKLFKKIMGIGLRTPMIVNRILKKKDIENATNAERNPGSFETKVQPPTEEYPAIYHNLVCPLANFAKEYGYMEYMPYVCNLDYVMFEAVKVPFYREKTCAAGDEYCDFKLKAKAPVVPAWPCHGVNPNDPLK